MRRIEFDDNGGQNPFCPGTIEDFFNIRFTRVEPPLSVLSVENESLEIAEPVVNKAGHFATKRPTFFPAVPLVFGPPLPLAGWRRQNQIGIPAHCPRSVSHGV